jgi:DCN1-like protein 1/2
MAMEQELLTQELVDIRPLQDHTSREASKILTLPPPSFFNNPINSNTASNPTRKALDQIFDNYRPKDSPNELDIEGTSSLLDALNITIDSVAALYFFQFTNSPQLGQIPREGFVSGPFLEANCDSLGKIAQHIQNSQLSARGTMEQYKAVYNHAFTLLIEDRKKAIDLEHAEEFWRTLTDAEAGFAWVGKSGTDFLPLWLEFLNTKWQKAVNRDLWRQTLAFMTKAVEDESLGFWSEESSWPSVIDDFVGWVKVEKRGEEAMEE